MLSEKSKVFVNRWLEEDHSWLFRQRMRIMALWHNKVPRTFRFFGALNLVFKGALICAGPAAAAFYGSVPIASAATVALVLVALNLGTAFADRYSKVKSNGSDYQSEAAVRFGDLLSTVRKGGIPVGQRDMATAACLGIIENFCLPITKAQKGEISVALIMYEGSSIAKLKVAKRNPGNERPVNRPIKAEHLLGHYACQHGASPRVVNHIGHFGRDFAMSPTQTRVNYKSILILPLECDSAEGKKIRGFVSIDSTRPYAFFGNRANVVVVVCDPIISQLRELVSGG